MHPSREFPARRITGRTRSTNRHGTLESRQVFPPGPAVGHMCLIGASTYRRGNAHAQSAHKVPRPSSHHRGDGDVGRSRFGGRLRGTRGCYVSHCHADGRLAGLRVGSAGSQLQRHPQRVRSAPTSTQALDVGDSTGAGAGWNITGTSTTFTAGARTLPTTATTVAAGPTVACDASVTCTTATNSVTYPCSLPAATTAPTATKLFNAAASTGMGNQTVTPTWKLSIPANSFAGSYTSTWTLSLVSGP